MLQGGSRLRFIRKRLRRIISKVGTVFEGYGPTKCYIRVYLYRICPLFYWAVQNKVAEIAFVSFLPSCVRDMNYSYSVFSSGGPALVLSFRQLWLCLKN